MDRIGSNGVHAVVVAPELVSVEIARIGQTYQLLIVLTPSRLECRRARLEVESVVLYPRRRWPTAGGIARAGTDSGILHAQW